MKVVVMHFKGFRIQECRGHHQVCCFDSVENNLLHDIFRVWRKTGIDDQHFWEGDKKGWMGNKCQCNR